MAINCSTCPDSIPASCVPYDGAAIPCVSPSSTPSVAEMVYLVGAKVCGINTALSNLASGWALNGNTVGVEKWIGTADNFRFPIRTNNVEQFSIETTGEIWRRDPSIDDVARFSIVSTSDEGNMSLGFGALEGTLTGFGNTAIGYNALHSAVDNSSSTALGYLAGYGSEGDGNTLIGHNSGLSLATQGNDNTFVGNGSGSGGDGSNNSGLGSNSVFTSLASNSCSLGVNTSISSNDCIAIGSGASALAQGQCVIGSEGHPITTMYLGKGALSASAAGIVVSATDTSGTNIFGSNIGIASGKGTGTGLSGDVTIKTSIPASASGATAHTASDRIKVLGRYTTLTEGVATNFASITMAAGTVAGGSLLLTIEANDGSISQVRTQRFIWAAVDQFVSGVTTITLSTPEEVVNVISGTLTCTVTAVDNGFGFTFKANATSSITQTVLRCNCIIEKNFGTGLINSL